MSGLVMTICPASRTAFRAGRGGVPIIGVGFHLPAKKHNQLVELRVLVGGKRLGRKMYSARASLSSIIFWRTGRL